MIAKTNKTVLETVVQINQRYVYLHFGEKNGDHV